MTSAELDHRFRAGIEKDGVYPTFLTVPDSAALLGTGRAVEVAGTLDGRPFEATLMPSGNGPHWLPLRAAMCRQLGRSAAGEMVDVHLRERRQRRTPTGSPCTLRARTVA